MLSRHGAIVWSVVFWCNLSTARQRPLCLGCRGDWFEGCIGFYSDNLKYTLGLTHSSPQRAAKKPSASLLIFFLPNASSGKCMKEKEERLSKNLKILLEFLLYFQKYHTLARARTCQYSLKKIGY